MIAGTGWWLAGCAAAGMLAGAAASAITRRYVAGNGAVLSSWWLGAALTGLVVAVLAWRVGDSGEFAVYAFVAVISIPLALIDWAQFRLPHSLIWLLLAGVLAGYGALCLIRKDVGPGMRAAAALLALAGGFLVLAVAVPGGVGAGDVRLAGAIGLVAGWSSWIVVVTALSAALLLALFMLPTLRLRRGLDHDRRAQGVPFGPCLLGGLLIAVAVTGG